MLVLSIVAAFLAGVVAGVLVGAKSVSVMTRRVRQAWEGSAKEALSILKEEARVATYEAIKSAEAVLTERAAKVELKPIPPKPESVKMAIAALRKSRSYYCWIVAETKNHNWLPIVHERNAELSGDVEKAVFALEQGL